jgi:predicted RNase H-like nuclease (RuvC/YqgF family)
VEKISTEESSTNQQTIQVAATRTGRSVTLEDFYGRPDIKPVSEEQKKKEMRRQEDERLREKEKENSELIKGLKSDNEELKKQLADKTAEASNLKRDNEALTEKTQPEMLKEINERFSDEPGLIKGDKLQKVNEAAGKNIVRMLERYNSILNDAVVHGRPIPVGLYVIARPENVLVPIRVTVDFRLKRIDISLWEKKLQ